MTWKCRKSDRDSEPKNAAPIDHTTAESIFNEVFRTVHTLAWENSLLNGPQDTIQSNSADNCIDTIMFAYTTVTFPNTVVMDYGVTESTCNGGYKTKGKLKATFSNVYKQSGSSVDVSFSNLYLDSIRVSGTMTITNNGYNTDSNYVFSIKVSDAILEHDTINVSWNSNRKYEWILGDETDLTSDDQFKISGSASGRTSNGNEFSVEILENLTYSMSCEWISEGEIEIDLGESLTPRILNYGSGSCDNEATVSYKGTSYELEMR